MDMFDGVGRRQDKVKGSFLDIGQHSLNGRERNCLFRNNGDKTFSGLFVKCTQPTVNPCHQLPF